MSKKSRKRKLEGEEQPIINWEEENIFPANVKNEMESMWEIPQIFHFLHLAKEALNIPHLSMYEMERMFLIPRASKQLANIMTSLLSSPITKAKLRKIPPMPYEFWTNILAYKMKTWFKVYEAKHRDAVKVLETIGVEPEFWNVFPDAPLLNGKDFEELTFKQKVWLLKTICDTVMHTRKTVLEEIAKQPWEDQFETLLGTDRYGARYIYFPQFLKSDLRIYTHCLDNKILSTSKPIKPKLKTNVENEESNQNGLMRKQTKRRRRKSRWSTGLPPRSKKKANRCDEKHLNDCKCNSDSATGSLINEDTNLSSTSNYSNNNNNNNDNNNANNSNNNNINFGTINVKRSRSSSKCSVISTESVKTHCTKSSGYDTNNSVDTPENKLPQRMFKGFSDDNADKKCNINTINGILTNLKTKLTEEKAVEEDTDISLMQTSQSNVELSSTRQQYVDTIDLQINKSGCSDKTIDNLSSVSKTDDEKLNEIISAESLKLNDKSNAVRETHQISTSKSDDEKISETRTSYSTAGENASLHRGKKENEVNRPNGRFIKNKVSNNMMHDDKKITQSGQISRSTNSNETEYSIDKDLSLSELRRILQMEAMNDDYFNDGTNCSMRELKNEKANGWKQKVENFNEMLSELSVSKFQLVADSVSSLRDLISTFSQNSNHQNTDIDSENEPIPPCEIKLVKNLTELLASVEELEPSLRESMRKARGKLQKEWINFTEGSAEDQDSSGEGLGSNWWILGSQGCPMSTTGDATLQTLPQSTLSSAGTQNASNKNEDSQEEYIDHTEHGKSTDQESMESRNESAQSETQSQPEGSEVNNGQENAGGEEETKKNSKEEETEQETRRVLRARGVSSYTFYSDDEIEENELEEWADVEAVYAAPSAQAGSSVTYFNPKVRHADDRANEEDKDQDWILPGSRKRKNKRSSASRRLKSLQNKLQSIKADAFQNAAESTMTAPSNAKDQKEKPKIKEIQICKPKSLSNSVTPTANDSTVENHNAVAGNNAKETVPSTETNYNIENVESVHSELDIKDEGPIYDSAPSQYDNGYSANFNSNYVMLRTDQNPMNYYVMQPNAANVPENTIVQHSPVVSNIVPSIQQGYYMHGEQNYIVQNSQSNFMPPQTYQQEPQMIAAQQFIGHPGYVPYMVTTAQSPSGYMTTNPRMIAPQEMSQHPMMPIQSNSSSPARTYQSKYPMAARHGNPLPHNAVIRSSMPIRGNFTRTNNGRTMKNNQQQQQRAAAVRMQKSRKQNASLENSNKKTTSLIVLSDSDDEIEMIIHEKTGGGSEAEAKSTPRKNTVVQSRQNATVNSDDTTTTTTTMTTTKGTIPAQIIQRMNQGGISITPVKPAAPTQNTSTQLVVVVNETGSHYALALPNGSKLILTPEQVAQIRASNGGKLIL